MPKSPLITGQYINEKRQINVDFLKAFAILYMVLVHVYEELSIYYDGAAPGVFGYVVEFLGGPLAAPVFMFSMGLGMIYTKHRSPLELFKRGVFLFVFSYLFNFLHEGIPCLIVDLVNREFDSMDFLCRVLEVDILQFAGLSFMFTALLKKLEVPLTGMLVISLVMQVVGSVVPALETENPFVLYSLGLFVPTGEYSFFPMFMWFFYPVVGMLIGKNLKQVEDLERLHKLLLLCGVLLGAYTFSLVVNGVNPVELFTIEDELFYKQDLIRDLFNLFVIGFVSAVLFFTVGRIKSQKALKLVMTMSSRLNEIYINQWMLIGFVIIFQDLKLIPYFGYGLTALVAFIIVALSVLLSSTTAKAMDKINFV